jgi:formylglycine-generating enzyme required for sulfatase activity
MRGWSWLRWLAFLAAWATLASAAAAAPWDDNAESVALVIGNKNYREVDGVDYALRDALAMRVYLREALHFRDPFLEEDMTKGRFEYWFGGRDDPRGELWRRVQPGRSNVFVYYSGHGLPNPMGEQYLLAQDSYPTEREPGYSLARLYRSLAEIKQKIGPDRRVIVMLDACFTGRTGRDGDTLFKNVSAPPRIAPQPEAPGDIVKLLATSGSTYAHWDPQEKMGLFTSRFLRGVTGPAKGAAGSAVGWADLKNYVAGEVGLFGVGQQPEIDDATIDWPRLRRDVFEKALAADEDTRAYEEAGKGRSREALYDYAKSCAEPCGHRTEAKKRLDDMIWTEAATLANYREQCARFETGCPRDDKTGQGGGVAPPTPAPTVEALARPLPPHLPCGGVTTAALATRAPGPLSADEACALRPGAVFRELSDGPEMVVIPAGSFTMGSPKSEPGHEDDEAPQHVVTFAKPFAAGKFDVTVDQFAAFVKATGYDAGTEWKNPGFAQTGSHPVVDVSWDDAKAYVKWLSRQTGADYRLLSESEWEYAARGKTSPGNYPRYFFGDSEADFCLYGNNGVMDAKKGNAPCASGYDWTSPVGSFRPNPFGLYDVHGNVYQWVEDCYDSKSYSYPLVDGSPVESAECSARALRGGSCFNIPGIRRAAYRVGFNPSGRFYYLGFRAARTLPF